MSDTLQTICDARRVSVAEKKQAVSEQVLYELALQQSLPRGFHRALKIAQKHNKVGLIAEIKKASPSRGLIRADFDVAALAKAYENGGATCLSVLTEVEFFQGADKNLGLAKAASSLPVLRKDFMIDAYQILESRALGADCILIIMAALSDSQAAEFSEIAQHLGMDALIEVHDAEELERALTNVKSTLIGINNRNLKTLEVNLSTSENLRAQIPQNYTVICESGIATPADITRMRAANMHHFLVGESLMREADVALASTILLKS
jgi:indole-3-glycerol phosphate synthase